VKGSSREDNKKISNLEAQLKNGVAIKKRLDYVDRKTTGKNKLTLNS